MLLSSYRLDQYTDPDGFAVQVAAIFADYADPVLARATDPRNPRSIQRTHKFPPSMQEIGAALDATEEALRAEHFVKSAEVRGFRWDSQHNGFYNAEGERYVPEKHFNLPAVIE